MGDPVPDYFPQSVQKARFDARQQYVENIFTLRYLLLDSLKVEYSAQIL